VPITSILKKPLILAVLLASMVLLGACGPAPQAESSQEAALVEPTQAATEAPTLAPTEMPTPTEVPLIELPAGVDLYLLNSHVEEQIKLGYSASYLWDYENGRFGGGKLILNSTPDWDAYFLTQNSFPDGQAFLARFSKASGANYNLALQSGEFGTTGFRRWAFHGGDVYNMSNRQDEEWLGYDPLIGNLNLQVDSWYYLLLAGTEQGEFLAVVWDAQDPSLFARYSQEFGAEWTGRDWKFRIGAKGGEVYLDQLYRISFDGFQ